MPGSVLYTVVFFAWLFGAAGFVLGLHQMNSPATARSGNRLSAAGMAVAVLATLIWLALGGLRPGGLKMEAWIIIIAGFLIGGGIGLYLARSVKMTAMPQLVSLFNAVGGGAAALVAVHELINVVDPDLVGVQTSLTAGLDIVIGGVTFTGSLVAAGKLQGLVTGAPVVFPGSRVVNALLALAFVVGVGWIIADPASLPALLLTAAAGLAFGVTMVLPIGG